MMVSPGYSYEKAPEQDHFLRRRQTANLFRRILDRPQRSWRFNQTPLFLEFLKGAYDLECTPWGNPTYNVFGWQKPCYLLDEGYCESFDELMRTTEWSRYGRESGNPRCRDCMVHSGYEPSAVEATFGTLRGLLATISLMLLGRQNLGRRERARADEIEPTRAGPGPGPHSARAQKEQAAWRPLPVLAGRSGDAGDDRESWRSSLPVVDLPVRKPR